ncbi:MAG: aldehyde ferredoxin oxidoreductase family protein [Anaerolineae bacterium]|jgi:aldehyde:ferredoxin oxidoreductase|nr:aldehyde ferredoxin oxidoreductase family protein [Chloroflexota bacterium]
MVRSFHDRMARVDLSTGKITYEQPGVLYLRRYMGGWNVIADVLLREVPRGADPLGPQNKLIWAPGVLTGLAVSGASRNAVGAKSPLTGGFGAGESGGDFPFQFKRAGLDALIVEGVSATPVYLWVHDGQVEIRDATPWWGHSTKATLEGLREALGERRLGAALIGPAGENLVRYACIMNETRDAAGRCGLGAVMGSKRLKAVVAHGSLNLDGVDAERIRAMARECAEAVRNGSRVAALHQVGTGGADLTDGLLQGNLPVHNFRDGEWEGVHDLSFIVNKLGAGMEACTACAVRCKKVVRTEGFDSDYGGPEYETLGALGSTCGVSDLNQVSRGHMLCNAHSLDTIGTGVTIALAMEAFEKGLLTLEDTAGIDLRFGNGEAMLQMIDKIAHREGLGDLLADDLATVARRLGGDAPMIAMHTKGQAFPMHEPRLKRGMAIGYAVSPTGADHCHSLHDTGLINANEDGLLRIALRGMRGMEGLGVLSAVPLEDLGPEKVHAAKMNHISSLVPNCVTMCTFPGWTARELADMINAATGWDCGEYELLQVGERAATLARLFNVREGWGLDDDHLPERSYGPTRGGALAQGGIDREELREAVQLFYEMMGWDRETGIPQAARLQELGVGWAIACLP